MKDGLKSKVLEFRPKKEKGIRYIPYCDLGSHRGLILKEFVCRERECKHYYKLYIKR